MKPYIEPPDLTPELMKQVQKDILIFSNSEIWTTRDFRKFSRMLRQIIE